MVDGHDEFETLAVSHVLGGLDQATASSFRRHLVGCRQCKAQVAELRALAGSLEDAAREERAVLALQTRARREVTTDDEVPEATAPPLPRRMLVAIVLVVLSLGALMIHNLHLQSREAALEAEVTRLDTTLSGLSRALPMDPVFAGGASGVVMADGEQVSWSIAGLPTPSADQAVVVWLLQPDEQARTVTHLAGDLQDGRISGTTEDYGARELQITLEDLVDGAPPTEPSGPVSATVDLTTVRELDDRTAEVDATD